MKLIAQLDNAKECNKKECIDCAKCIMPDKRGDRYRYPQKMQSSYDKSFGQQMNQPYSCAFDYDKMRSLLRIKGQDEIQKPIYQSSKQREYKGPNNTQFIFQKPDIVKFDENF